MFFWHRLGNFNNKRFLRFFVILTKMSGTSSGLRRLLDQEIEDFVLERKKKGGTRIQIEHKNCGMECIFKTFLISE